MQRPWETKKDLVTKAIERLNDPQFALKQLTLSIKSFDHNVNDAESALQVLKLFFSRSKNIILNQDCANEIHESLPDSTPQNQNGALQITGTRFKKDVLLVDLL